MCQGPEVDRMSSPSVLGLDSSCNGQRKPHTIACQRQGRGDHGVEKKKLWPKKERREKKIERESWFKYGYSMICLPNLILHDCNDNSYGNKKSTTTTIKTATPNE